MMHSQFQQFNPFRIPQWRSERALELAKARPTPARPTAADDDYVRAYRVFLMQYYSEETSDGRLSLFPDNPGLFYAHLLHIHPDREWRGMCQAFLLAGEDDDQLARRLCTLASAIEWYEALFFNVRDRLDCQSWIVKTVLGSRLQRAANREGSITEHQAELLYKLFGYFGGSEVLDVIVGGLIAGQVPRDTAGIPGWFDSTMKTLVRSKSAMMAKVFEHNRYTVMQLMEIHLAIMNLEQSGNQGPITESEKNIETMLMSMGQVWGLANRGLKTRNPEQLEYAVTAIEPRASEALLLGAGKVPETLESRKGRIDKTRLINPKEFDLKELEMSPEE